MSGVCRGDACVAAGPGTCDERERLNEIEIVLDVFAPHRRAGTPHLLAGDFNANSPTHVVDLDRCKPATRRDWAANGGRLPREVVTKLTETGYIDSLHATDP